MLGCGDELGKMCGEGCGKVYGVSGEVCWREGEGWDVGRGMGKM